MLALAHYRAACRAAPGDSDGWYNQGVLLERLGRGREAIDCYRRTLLSSPDHHGALTNACQLVRVHEHFAEAVALARRLRAIDPGGWHGPANEAIALLHMGEFDAADAMFALAIERAPEPAHLHWEQHFSMLARRRFAQAWQQYEFRFACSAANGVDRMAIDLPEWAGDTAAHVLVFGEQGLGDQIMFACALREMASACSRLSLAVHPVLAPLMAASFPDVKVHSIADGQDPAACEALLAKVAADRPIDAALPMGSLMQRFRSDAGRFDPRPYLRPSDGSRAFWAGDRAPGGRFRLGLCWASNPATGRFFSSRRAVHKTMPLDHMAPFVAHPGIETLAVTNVPLAQFGAAPHVTDRIRDVSAHLVDLDRTAALIETLDLLITVDTGVAHLAGALGVPVWILLHQGGDARWGLPGDASSYWYESARLFWQERPGDWAELVGRVDARLEGMLAALRPGVPVAGAA